MRVLLSTIGTRGDVQPLVALGLQLRALGQQVHFCAPPDFGDWIDGLGFPVTLVGPELRRIIVGGPPAPPSPERLRELLEASVAAQFEKIARAAQGCDAIVAATALQVAARSLAEAKGILYLFAAYCPAVLPSRHHPPSLTPFQAPASAGAGNRERWARDAESFNATFGAVLNAHRASLGLAPVDDVRSHVFSERPWLAADPTLAPWPEPEERAVFQPGAWIVPDESALPSQLETFLDAGEPPVYFGFGSMRGPEGLSHVMIQAARALGRRSIMSRGWADMALVDEEPDCLSVGEVNHQALFRRVAAVVHHGGAGTTTAAALAGAPQVVIPQSYDQHYWAQRIAHLGIGAAHSPGAPTTTSLTRALIDALRREVAARAASVAYLVRYDGAQHAAERLLSMVEQ
jgi:vancomycin aglycone glucosyltransferase